jgi:large subunit ribosomal protein L29
MSKVTEFRDLTDEEISQRAGDAKRELFNLKLQRVAGQLENPARIRHLRRDLARMETVRSERRRGGE